jgi:phage baseplate assembly protein W
MADEPDFGTTLSCVNDFASDARMVSGFAVVGEAIARRWSTPRGRLIAYPNYGFDLSEYVNADMSPRDIAGLRAGAAAEAEKDERVERCSVSAVLGTDGVLTLTALVQTTKGPFTLVVRASAVTVDLVSITPGV